MQKRAGRGQEFAQGQEGRGQPGQHRQYDPEPAGSRRGPARQTALGGADFLFAGLERRNNLQREKRIGVGPAQALGRRNRDGCVLGNHVIRDGHRGQAQLLDSPQDSVGKCLGCGLGVADDDIFPAGRVGKGDDRALAMQGGQRYIHHVADADPVRGHRGRDR